jgi:hypothetical protein
VLNITCKNRSKSFTKTIYVVTNIKNKESKYLIFSFFSFVMLKLKQLSKIQTNYNVITGPGPGYNTCCVCIIYYSRVFFFLLKYIIRCFFILLVL